MVRRELAAVLIERHLLDHGLTPEEFGAEIGVAGMTIRRVLDPRWASPPSVKTRFRIARGLGEDVTTIWPVKSRVRVEA